MTKKRSVDNLINKQITILRKFSLQNMKKLNNTFHIIERYKLYWGKVYKKICSHKDYYKSHEGDIFLPSRKT